MPEVRAARAHLTIDARLDLAREERIAEEVLAAPSAVRVPAAPPNEIAHQTDRPFRRVAVGV